MRTGWGSFFPGNPTGLASSVEFPEQFVILPENSIFMEQSSIKVQTEFSRAGNKLRKREAITTIAILFIVYIKTPFLIKVKSFIPLLLDTCRFLHYDLNPGIKKG